ncbi:MAG: ribonuclease P protein component [Granulosicoccus sp.]|nr:ribonuclease P protein component [Granulosicoccus sp.]
MTGKPDLRSVADVAQEKLAFPRTARLLSTADYSQVFARSKRYTDRYWTILVRVDDASPARLGLAIAKKRARRAVDRNRLKRVAREAFRHNRSALTGLDMVVMNRDAATSAASCELREALEALFLKMHTGSAVRGNQSRTQVSS